LPLRRRLTGERTEEDRLKLILSLGNYPTPRSAAGDCRTLMQARGSFERPLNLAARQHMYRYSVRNIPRLMYLFLSDFFFLFFLGVRWHALLHLARLRNDPATISCTECGVIVSCILLRSLLAIPFSKVKSELGSLFRRVTPANFN
jgi:hypothetical protein